MMAKPNATAQWRCHLIRDLALRNQARIMLERERDPDRESVMIFACVAINRQLCEDIIYLGGMAAAW